MNIVSNAELLVTILKTTSISDEHQALITLFHDLVEGAIKGQLMYDPCYQTHTEYYPLQTFRKASQNLILRNIPIRRVTSIIQDENGYAGQAADAFTEDNGAETLVSGEDYYVTYTVDSIGGSNGLNNDDRFCASGIVKRISGYWPCQPGSLKVVYVAGYTEKELRGAGSYHTAGEIKKATIDALVASFRELTTQANAISSNTPGIKTSESMGDYSYSLDSMSLALTTFQVVIPATSHAHLQHHIHYGQLGI